VALTLRLDRARYTRLKITRGAARARSGQELLLRALDAYLEACAVDCACLRSSRRGENWAGDDQKRGGKRGRASDRRPGAQLRSIDVAPGTWDGPSI
jgi:hypothetical protein